MFARGQLRLHWLSLEGRPAAAEYHFAGGGISYLYQGGMEPELFQENPGNLAHIAAIRGAMAEGYRAMDFMRGDEPYKKHFRAQERPCWEVRVVPPRLSSRLRDGAWQTARRAKRWWNTSSPFAPRKDEHSRSESRRPDAQPAEVDA
jgi:CelD/BcsL family acetyltransferase involved in cellulose biosynthesis